MKNRITTILALLAVAFATPAMAGFGSRFDNGLNGIIGGVNVAPSDPVARTTVLIIAKEFNSTSICTGSIIDTDLVLTAAHCVGLMTGRAEVVVAFRTQAEGSGPVIAVADRERPADFLGRARLGPYDWHDIAVLRLARPIPPGFGVAKILPDRSLLQAGRRVLLAGYGMNMPVTPEDPRIDNGAGTLRKVDQVVIEPKHGQTEFLVSLTGGKGSCHGDSGGPAFVNVNGQLYLAGVTSRMTEKGRIANNGNVRDFSCSVEMVYTSVNDSMGWIRGAIGRLRQKQQAEQEQQLDFFDRLGR